MAEMIKNNGASAPAGVTRVAAAHGAGFDAAEVLAMAEEAEAEAAEAEALAAAARARAKAIRLRRQAASAPAEAPPVSPAAEAPPLSPAAEAPPPSPPDSSGEPANTDEQNTDEQNTDIAAPVGETPPLPPETPPLPPETPPALPGTPPLLPQTWPARSGRRWWARVGLGVAGALICALLVAAGYLQWQHREAVAQRHRSAEFAAAARQGVVSLMTMDFNHAKDDVQRVLDNSTGQFRDDFQTRAGDFTKVVQDAKVVTKGTVNATAVQSMTDNSAVVLVSATSQVTNATGAQNEPRAWRLSVTVARDGGQIKMSRVEFVP